MLQSSRAAAYKKMPTAVLLHANGRVLRAGNPQILYPDLVSTNESDVTSGRNEHRRSHVSRNVCILIKVSRLIKVDTVAVVMLNRDTEK